MAHRAESTGVSTYKRAKYDYPLDRRTIQLILRVFELPEDFIEKLPPRRSRLIEPAKLPFLGNVCA